MATVIESGEFLIIEHIDTTEVIKQRIQQFDIKDQLSFLSELYTTLAEMQNIFIPGDFLQLSLQAMVQLRNSGRTNFLYGLARGLSIQRPDEMDSLFPSKKLISGLVEYSVNFFNSDKNAQHVSFIL